MSTVFDPLARATLLARLARLAPDSRRRWGRMRPPEMLWHLDAQLRHLLGEFEVAPVERPFLRNALVRWFVVGSPLPWPRGFRTAPELERFAPRGWEEDRAALLGRLERIVARGEAAAAFVHPIFGPFDGRGCGRLIWRHWNHHLTQFGA